MLALNIMAAVLSPGTEGGWLPAEIARNMWHCVKELDLSFVEVQL